MSFNKNVFDKFAIEGDFLSAEAFGDGHINDTFLVKVNNGESVSSYVFQRLNRNAFKDIPGLMNNFTAVTEYFKKKLEKEGADVKREVLNLVYTKDGGSYYEDEEGGAWRVTLYVQNSMSYTIKTRPEQIYESTLAFGKFQRALKDFPADTLSETIPDFHNTTKRFEALLSAAEKDTVSRLGGVVKEYEFALARREFCNTLENMKSEGILPLRVTHNDTKLNNVLFDTTTDKAICVIDLDTVMPGLSVNDFGDAVRASTSTGAEDETDLSKVNFDIDLYELAVRGFLDGTDGSLSEAEIREMPTAAIMMTLECGIRFLTDYLSGDVYFKIARPDHNLDRARTQFKLVYEMEQKFEEMRNIVNKYSH